MDKWLRKQSIGVTGGRGALGRRILKRLVDEGTSKIVTFGRHPAAKSDFLAESASVVHEVGNILNSGDLDRALRGCSVVFHLAGLAHVGLSDLEPLTYFEVNAFGTASVLEACRRLGIARVIYVSTGHVYGIPRRLPVTEDHPTRPLSAYAASKLAGEAAVQAYATSFGFCCDIARLANVYGASFNTETVIGYVLAQVTSGASVSLRNLDAVRDFIYVDDVVDALLRLALPADSGCRVVNVSTGQGVRVGDLAATLLRVAAEEGWEPRGGIQEAAPMVERVPELILDNRFLLQRTGWVPELSLEQGLRLTLREFGSEQQRLVQ